MSKLLCVRWGGNNLEEVRYIFGDITIYENNKRLVLPVKGRNDDVVSYWANLGDYVFKNTDISNEYMILNEERYNFLKEFLTFEKGLNDSAEGKIDKILEKLTSGSYCAPIYQKNFE